MLLRRMGPALRRLGPPRTALPARRACGAPRAGPPTPGRVHQPPAPADGGPHRAAGAVARFLVQPSHRQSVWHGHDDGHRRRGELPAAAGTRVQPALAPRSARGPPRLGHVPAFRTGITTRGVALFGDAGPRAGVSVIEQEITDELVDELLELGLSIDGPPPLSALTVVTP